MDARFISVKVIHEVISKRKHLDQVLSTQLITLKDPREKSLARELSYGIMRFYPRLTHIARLLLRKSFKPKDEDVLVLICSGLYQLDYMRIPDHAAISATVETARKLGKPWACELINAVLRRYQREKSLLQEKVANSEIAHYSHPQWMISLLRDEWPDHWREILESNNQHPPLQLRVNLQRHSRDDYLRLLEQSGIAAIPCQFLSTGITVSKPVNVDEIPGFQTGDVSVQDFGAQLAVNILDPQAGQRVLDACAAPGGKTGHIIEYAPEIAELIAVESDQERTELLRANIDRLGLSVHVVNADVSDVSAWWDGRCFDRILLDAPCSAIGVIRRHPDIKVLRAPGHIHLFTGTQSKILESVWPLLKPGGRLVYSTCSILNAESDDQIATFANKYDDARILSIDADWGIRSPHGRYILPGQDQTDGFYYALMTKTPE